MSEPKVPTDLAVLLFLLVFLISTDLPLITNNMDEAYRITIEKEGVLRGTTEKLGISGDITPLVSDPNLSRPTFELIQAT